MRVLGVDFTSSPRPGKPITVTRATLDGDRLRVDGHDRLSDFAAFEAVLASPGPWLAGLDFPFSFARPFLERIGWPVEWPALARYLAAIGKAAYLNAHHDFRTSQPEGSKHLPRALDRLTGGAAPNNVVNPPVGRMLYEGVPRLLASGASVPGLHDGNSDRRVVEAYPAVAARHLIGTTAYKDGPLEDGERRRNLRRDLLAALAGPNRFGVMVDAPERLADDPAGDDIDALLCAVQAAWAVRAGLSEAGPVGRFDPAEGWIADPNAFDPPLGLAPNSGTVEGDVGKGPSSPGAAPPDADARRAVAPVICYPTDALAKPDLALYRTASAGAETVARVIVPPRDAAAIEVPAGSFLRITCTEGPQVGDLNLFNARDLSERFYSGKTRALHGTHVTTGDRLWSSFPTLRPMATVARDTLDWYGIDPHGGAVHDVIGTRCDPYTGNLLSASQYHRCCHSNLTRALAGARGLSLAEAERHVHDVLNVFMCTGFTRDTGQYFMKASPVRRGDYIEILAEIDLLAVLSACPGGDCGAEHSSDAATCHPLRMDHRQPRPGALAGWAPPPVNGYDRGHGA